MNQPSYVDFDHDSYEWRKARLHGGYLLLKENHKNLGETYDK